MSFLIYFFSLPIYLENDQLEVVVWVCQIIELASLNPGKESLVHTVHALKLLEKPGIHFHLFMCLFFQVGYLQITSFAMSK